MFTDKIIQTYENEKDISNKSIQTYMSTKKSL